MEDGAGNGTGHRPDERGELDELDELDQRLRQVSDAERARLLDDHVRPMVRLDPYDWVGELVRRVDRHGLSIPCVRTVVTDLAWEARKLGHPYPDGRAWSELLSGASSRAGRLVLLYVEGQRLRFDYRFEALARRSDEWLRSYGDDALVLALAAFAALGRRAPQGLDLWRAALDARDADTKSRHVCLAAMWFAHHLDGQAEHLLDLSNAMIARGEADANVFYRRAAALRKLGRFEQAVEDIDRAISMLLPGDNPVHQDYVRERELTLASTETRAYLEDLGTAMSSRLSRQVDDQVTAASRELEARVEAAHRVVADGLLRIVEILGLFVALIGFLAGSGAIVVTAQSVHDRVVSMLLVLGGSLAFFLLLRLALNFRRR